MRTLLMLAFIIGGSLLFFIGGAGIFFAAGGPVGGTIQELVLDLPYGKELWRSPWYGLFGGPVLVAIGFWLSRN